jgi:hypothetical protein
MNAPVTHADLKGSLDGLRNELREDMKQIREDMKKMHDDLSRELARHVTASAEQTQRLIVGLDDRYRDLPGRVTALERELDEHRRDTALHPRRRR